MSTHWVHITASYVLVLGGFLAMAVATMRRLSVAKRLLAQLDTRARRGKDIA